MTVSGTSNTYTGGTTIVRGTLAIGANDALPTGTTLNVDLSSAGEDSTFDLNGFSQEIGSLTRTGSGSGAGGSEVTNSSATAGTLTLNQTATTTYDGVISGNLALVKNNTGQITLSGANTYDGNTNINDGTVVVAHSTALGSTNGSTTVTTGTAAQLRLDGTAGDLTIAEALSVGARTGGSVIQNVAGNNTVTGAVTLTGGADFRQSGGSNTFSGGITGTNTNLAFNGNYVVDTLPVNIGNGVFTTTSATTQLNVAGNAAGLLRINFGGEVQLLSLIHI